MELAPRAATGMAVGAQVSQPQPAPIATAPLGAEVLRGLHGARPAVGRRHRLRGCWRPHVGMGGLVFTQDALRPLGQAGKRLGLVRAFSPRLDGRLRLAWPPRGPRTAARPGQMEHDTEPEKSEERELIEKQRRNHGIAPLHGGVMGGLYRVLRRKQLSAARRYTARSLVAYLLAADNVSRPLPTRLREVNQPVISPRNVFSTPRYPLLACI